jgi:hypothetical protein
LGTRSSKTTDIERTMIVSMLTATRTLISDLNAEVSSIDIVSQEQVSRLCRVATHFKELHEIVVLPMNITTHSDGRIHLQQIRLRLQDLGAFFQNP